MKTLVSFCKLESDVLAKFTIRVKRQSEQYKAITLRNVIEGNVLMACTASFLLSKYQFFTLARIHSMAIAVRSINGQRVRFQRPFIAEASVKHSFNDSSTL